MGKQWKRQHQAEIKSQDAAKPAEPGKIVPPAQANPPRKFTGFRADNVGMEKK